MDADEKRQIALWRFSVLGALVSAELEHGERSELLQQAEERQWKDWRGEPTARDHKTIERWYYAYKRGGLKALEPQDRSDLGTSRAIRPEIAELILRLKRERPRRSIRRIRRILERAGKVHRGELKRSTIHRLLRAHDLSARPRRNATERRAFRHSRAGELWMGDVMHGPRVLDGAGGPRKSYLHLFLDSATRFVPAAAFRLGETASDHEAVLKQAILKHGRPRILYVDRGAAQTSGSLREICGELAIQLLHTRPRDPEAKAAVERIFRTAREEILDELDEEPIELAELNRVLWAWLSAEYHRREHGGTGRIPLQHWLEQVDAVRSAPRAEDLDQIFLHRERRKVRKDSTVRFAGRLLEVRPELAGRQVELRFDPERPEALPQVFIDGDFVCDTRELDLEANSRRLRRQLASGPEETSEDPTGLSPLQQIRDEHERRARKPHDPATEKE